MAAIRFEWDEKKSAANRRKHGVTFEEARTAFLAKHGSISPDPDHSASEDRFILLGMSASLRTLIVCHCYRQDQQLIRIFSARKANSAERAQYQRG